jgi:membrane protein YqaA with SNARE-associated domain
VPAYLTLFGWSFLAATILPLGSEAVLVVMVLRGSSIAAAVLVATAGNYLGACTTYWLGSRAARLVEQRHPGSRREQRAATLVRRWGQPLMVLSWVPVIGDALVAAAGAVRMPFWPFTFWIVLGKLGRYAAVAWATESLIPNP